MKTTLGQLQLGMLPATIGACADDLPTLAAYVNRAQQQLINAGGETGWFGGWQKTVFSVSRCNPYLTLPRQFARIINLDVCRFPIRIQNEFYEMLEAGIGLQDFCKCPDWCGALEGYERGVWPTMVDLTPTNQFLRVLLTDPRDVGKRILIAQSLDQNGNPIYSQDGNNSVNGFYLALAQPFATSGFIVTHIGGIQKDLTFGDVLLYQVDATTGAQVLLSRYGPDEFYPAYRRYYFHRLPCGCGTVQVPSNPCAPGVTVPTGNIPVTAMCKLEFIPATRATDFLVIGNEPALIEECKAIRYADQDSPNATQLQLKAHARAIQLLNEELTHYLGTYQPAVVVAPFGTAKISRVMCAVRNG